ncbi:conserved hypothetical protein [Candidatus Zixiibacteriota bacterium]|nr:conserved hypothetical protein [candidate division Zixibacteria bacterium]
MTTYKSSFIAFCGTRGVPANYGGFETAVDEISRRLAAKGNHCLIFCRLSSGYKPAEDKYGRKLIYIKGSRHRKLDTFISSMQTGWYLWKHRREFRFIFWFNNANFPGIVMTWLAALPMAVNTDGLEWRRKKWSWPFKFYYLASSFIICRLCKRLISDSLAIQDFYLEKFLKNTSYIPYGYPEPIPIDNDFKTTVLEKYGLKRGKYYLQITRLEPDNIPLDIARNFVRAFINKRGYKLVIVGYKEPTPYALKLKSLHGQNDILVLDAVYDAAELAVLRSNCFCYVHGNSVGGTNPALLEAMAFCPRVMAIDSEFSHEVLGDSGFYFRPDEMINAFQQSLLLFDRAKEMKVRLNEFYRWDKVAASYLNLAEKKSADYNVGKVSGSEEEESFEEAFLE